MQTQTVTINFKGGIVSPGHLKEILQLAQVSLVKEARFSLRQQMIMEVPAKHFEQFMTQCAEKNITAMPTTAAMPNIVSSYPAAGIFTHDSWLREGVYKDLFDLFNFTHQLKINICDSQQCFVPFFSGHINWIASASEHFWHLYIRFPKTNRLYKWKDFVYSNDLPRLSRKIEEQILSDRFLFYANQNADGDLLYQRVKSLTAYVSKPAVEEPTIDFSLPYYEGFNKAGNQLWLGIYRRDEWYPVNFLLDVCDICLRQRIGQLYTTPWKSIIIKYIDPANRRQWDLVLGRYRINVRHAANELNWQVEDGIEEGLHLKRQLIRYFDKEDVRTFGLCFAVQTKPTSSMFGTIQIKKQVTKNPHRLKSLERYDIVYKKKFNPNEPEEIVFREAVEKEHIGVYLVSLCKFYYEQIAVEHLPDTTIVDQNSPAEKIMVHQCRHCLTVYDPIFGDAEQKIEPGTAFADLPSSYSCPLCEAPRSSFEEVDEINLKRVV